MWVALNVGECSLGMVSRLGLNKRNVKTMSLGSSVATPRAENLDMFHFHIRPGTNGAVKWYILFVLEQCTVESGSWWYAERHIIAR